MPQAGITSRERDVLAIVAQGRSNHPIAACPVITERTVEAQIDRRVGTLGLLPEPGTNRRLLVVLTFLRST